MPSSNAKHNYVVHVGNKSFAYKLLILLLTPSGLLHCCYYYMYIIILCKEATHCCSGSYSLHMRNKSNLVAVVAHFSPFP